MVSKIVYLNLASAFFFIPSGSIQADDKKAPEELQGAWKLVKVEINEEAQNLGDRQPRWIIKGNKIEYGGEELATLNADSGTSPKLFDLHFKTSKKDYEGIYSIEKDTLKICINGKTTEIKERPDTFSTKDKEHFRVYVFERDKAEKADPFEGLTGFVGVALRYDGDKKQIIVMDTIEGSPAKRDGLKKDDIVLKIGDTPATELQPTVEAVRQNKPGSNLVIRVERDGKEKDITIKVGVIPFQFLGLLE
jgi:uncharacterized protein (TIGR03067 family)